MVVKDVSGGPLAERVPGGGRAHGGGARFGDSAAHLRMAEELNRVNSDLCRALAGLQEVIASVLTWHGHGRSTCASETCT